ncbi:hypothetical protein EC991_003297 [Linnemannia zychae]|nr:hypothetical protein EC991_003297 [Linnemannia zychae]
MLLQRVLLDGKDGLSEMLILLYGFEHDSNCNKNNITWSIANPTLEQLESLTIPLADIRRYMDAISRLGKLEHVRFNLDESFKSLYKATDSPRDVVSNHAIKSMQTMVPFIKEHQRLFKGQLKTVSVCDKLTWYLTSALCPKEILWQVAQASLSDQPAPVGWPCPLDGPEPCCNS